MLVDFTAENYRSIREPVLLSAVAQAGRGDKSEKKASGKGKETFGRSYIKLDQEIAPSFPLTGRSFELLPALGIFGANASGKSNVFLALDTLLDLMASGNLDRRASSLAPLENIAPFGLSDIPFGVQETTLASQEAAPQSPTRFQLRVTLEGIIYTYFLSLNQQFVIEERLEQMPPTSKRSRLLFSRSWDKDSDQYLWKSADNLGVYRRVQATIKKHETFLSLLTTRFNVDALQPLADWTNIRWSGLGHESFNHTASVQQLTRLGPEWRERIVKIMRQFDTGLSDIEVVAKQPGASEQKLIAVHHLGATSVRWPFEEESTGTQRLFDLANKVLSCLDYGGLILEDELGSNIHPHISREIIRLFQSTATNPKRAQLLFTSHDNTLQQRNLLRRDQIWFTQKRPDGSTDLYPLTDFKPRNDLAIDKSYLDGRFGAVPILPDTEDLLQSPKDHVRRSSATEDHLPPTTADHEQNADYEQKRELVA